MTFSLAAQGIRGILLDVEGTVTPIEFVTGVLFPFARARAEAWLRENRERPEARAELGALRAEHAEDTRRGASPPGWPEGAGEAGPAAAYVRWLMDQDRKSTALKSLQGRIWEEGYRSGALRSEVFEDVPPALARWSARRIDLRIFSSGSVLAQKLLFTHTRSGDLSVHLRGYFDTSTGPKSDPASYARIAGSMQLHPPQVLFISDVTAELRAAEAAGMRTLLAVRPGNRPQPDAERFASIRALSDVED